LRFVNAPLPKAILAAFEHAEIELNHESREMMRIASADERVWRYFLGATTRMQPTLAATLRASAPETSDDAELLWEVRASALLGAIATAYRQWATIPDSELADLVAEAVDVVLPAIMYQPQLGHRGAPAAEEVLRHTI
jgi:hypothetical protein